MSQINYIAASMESNVTKAPIGYSSVAESGTPLLLPWLMESRCPNFGKHGPLDFEDGDRPCKL